MDLGIIATLYYGILALVGGIIGYVQANSQVSLLSGSISGLLLKGLGLLRFLCNDINIFAYPLITQQLGY
ncbi:TMEM14 family protein [aff. Roholtiella sp. LEGE 12411]|uniref:TMEM14 family protein n=1 Tax=aff. Roholtiella sp. LEGE 12411 TaxID=1828822 RepID=UPI00187E52C0|nr:hypothetical protein [aff. Roholtiella sp. LEGE 12411]